MGSAPFLVWRKLSSSSLTSLLRKRVHHQVNNLADPENRGRQISLQIKKWGLEKNTKPEESLFMAQRQKYRRVNEPGKHDLKFRVRGKEHPAEDLARWES